jgi:hypothetical protein
MVTRLLHHRRRLRDNPRRAACLCGMTRKTRVLGGALLQMRSSSFRVVIDVGG